MATLLGVAVAFNITASNSTVPEDTTTTTTTTPMPRPRMFSDLGSLKLSARDVVFEAMEEEVGLRISAARPESGQIRGHARALVGD